jgi:hypothetical protein
LLKKIGIKNLKKIGKKLNNLKNLKKEIKKYTGIKIEHLPKIVGGLVSWWM